MLPKSKRLSTEVFQGIIEKGQSIHSPFLILRKSPVAGHSHFSVSVPKKVAKQAVARNKMRRQIYSIIEKMSVKEGQNVIIITKVGSEKLSFSQLSDELSTLFVKSSLLK